MSEGSPGRGTKKNAVVSPRVKINTHSFRREFRCPKEVFFRQSQTFQKQSSLAQWYRARTADSRRGTRKTMIVALARKLLIARGRNQYR